VGNLLHFAQYVRIDFGCALGIERTNADAADIVDMEPRMRYLQNVKRRAKCSATIMEGLHQAAVPDKTEGTRELVQAYLQARSKAEVLHIKSAGRVPRAEYMTWSRPVRAHAGWSVGGQPHWEAVDSCKIGGIREHKWRRQR
jgi:hypothetical protein